MESILLLVGLVIYFVPSIVAAKRDHPQTMAIALLNIIAGWTFVGWVAALVWSAMAIDRPRVGPVQWVMPESNPFREGSLEVDARDRGLADRKATRAQIGPPSERPLQLLAEIEPEKHHNRLSQRAATVRLRWLGMSGTNRAFIAVAAFIIGALIVFSFGTSPKPPTATSLPKPPSAASAPASVDSNLSDDQRAGLYWDMDNGFFAVAPEDRQWLRAGALRVLIDDKNCKRIKMGAHMSHPADDKEYYVTCDGPGREVYNVYFDKADVTAQPPLKPPPPYDESASRRLCQPALKKEWLTHPLSISTRSLATRQTLGRMVIVPSIKTSIRRMSMASR